MPWKPKEATDEIRKIANSANLTISYKAHARIRMRERALIISDVLYVLKNGFCYREALPSTREGFNKYEMESTTPNSNGRDVRIIVIPDKKACFLKIITVMWVDESSNVAGSIIGECDD